MLTPITTHKETKKVSDSTFTVEGFTFDTPVKKIPGKVFFTKYELGRDGVLVNSLYTESKLSQEQLIEGCKDAFKNLNLFK